MGRITKETANMIMEEDMQDLNYRVKQTQEGGMEGWSQTTVMRVKKSPSRSQGGFADSLSAVPPTPRSNLNPDKKSL
ncbi:hypothetical protein PoB_000362700 [Plakobranchus ocellatus]|uniref:Uncharacterized protein n=1 Tax=Plakobranchus ocellatus TaxID=259542 RepID=A0AAV3Y4U0_9GAST|nr:hypothetical protein PoB_000362700 [Plakobranchus ocellatus]